MIPIRKAWMIRTQSKFQVHIVTWKTNLKIVKPQVFGGHFFWISAYFQGLIDLNMAVSFRECTQEIPIGGGFLDIFGISTRCFRFQDPGSNLTCAFFSRWVGKKHLEFKRRVWRVSLWGCSLHSLKLTVRP